MDDGGTEFVGAEGAGSESGPERARRPRNRAFLITLLGLAWASVGCIALVLHASMDLEEEYQQASAALATPRVARPMGPRAAAGGTQSQDPVVAGATAVERRSASGGVGGALARPSSRHSGGRPDLSTPQGQRLFDGLVEAAREEQDVGRRAGAVRSLAGMFGSEACVALTGIADDPTQPAEVRELAGDLGRRNVEGGK